MTDRKYRMIRVGAGDYLLPSNDKVTLWRIYSYEEDGSAEYQDSRGKWRTVTGTFWATAKFARPFTPDTLADDLPDDPTDWEHWETWDVGHRTRQSAIDAALNWEPSKL